MCCDVYYNQHKSETPTTSIDGIKRTIASVIGGTPSTDKGGEARRQKLLSGLAVFDKLMKRVNLAGEQQHNQGKASGVLSESFDLTGVLVNLSNILDSRSITTMKSELSTSAGQVKNGMRTMTKLHQKKQRHSDRGEYEKVEQCIREMSFSGQRVLGIVGKRISDVILIAETELKMSKPALENWAFDDAPQSDEYLRYHESVVSICKNDKLSLGNFMASQEDLICSSRLDLSVSTKTLQRSIEKNNSDIEIVISQIEPLLDKATTLLNERQKISEQYIAVTEKNKLDESVLQKTLDTCKKHLQNIQHIENNSTVCVKLGRTCKNVIQRGKDDAFKKLHSAMESVREAGLEDRTTSMKALGLLAESYGELVARKINQHQGVSAELATLKFCGSASPLTLSQPKEISKIDSLTSLRDRLLSQSNEYSRQFHEINSQHNYIQVSLCNEHNQQVDNPIAIFNRTKAKLQGEYLSNQQKILQQVKPAAETQSDVFLNRKDAIETHSAA